jgi:1-acyl-sn-glycerol-3-phosphate acyltransferase
MLEGLFRGLCLTLVRVYFPTRALLDAGKLPAAHKRIFVANHPNGLLDPLVLRIVTGVPTMFLAKSTLFANPFGRFAMRAFGAIPVYRRQDQSGDVKMQDGNEKTFALCRKYLMDGAPLALFPEGVSHADASLHELKTGAARIALSTDALLGAQDEVLIVPVGLTYEDRAVFRSAIVATVGDPITTRTFREAYQTDPRVAVDQLTDSLAAALSSLVVQASTRTVLDGVARVAIWTGAPELKDNPEARQRYAKQLVDAYTRWQTRDPAKLEAVVREVRHYDRILRALGVSDPWDLEIGHVRLLPAMRVLLSLLLMLPFATLGTLASWLPYRAVNPIAKRVTKNEDVLGTVKLLGGMLFVGIAWIAESLLIAWQTHGYFALPAMGIIALCSYIAVLFGEQLTVAIGALRHSWLRNTRPTLMRKLVARRQALANAVTEAINAAEASL